MWNYEKRLQYPVKITKTNPQIGQDLWVICFTPLNYPLLVQTTQIQYSTPAHHHI